jgi:hypothetical protein
MASKRQPIDERHLLAQQALSHVLSVLATLKF